MGETASEPFQLSFNGALNVGFQRPRVTSNWTAGHDVPAIVGR
jgi:hypothetical protein